MRTLAAKFLSFLVITAVHSGLAYSAEKIDFYPYSENFESDYIRQVNAELEAKFGFQIHAARWLCKGEKRGTINNIEFGSGWSYGEIVLAQQEFLQEFLRAAEAIGLTKRILPDNAMISVIYSPRMTSCEGIGALVTPLWTAGKQIAFLAGMDPPTPKARFLGYGAVYQSLQFGRVHTSDRFLGITHPMGSSTIVDIERANFLHADGGSELLKAAALSLAREIQNSFLASDDYEGQAFAEKLATLILREVARIHSFGIDACFVKNIRGVWLLCRKETRVENVYAVPAFMRPQLLRQLIEIRIKMTNLVAEIGENGLATDDERFKIAGMPETISIEAEQEYTRLIADE